MESKKAKNFAEVLAAVETFQSATDIPWYRGCSKSSYLLVPKIARGPSGKTLKFEDFHNREIKMAREFRLRAQPHAQGTLSDEWDLMFYMQHYGIPTRLLDWSSSPFVAMFFALKPRSSSYAEDPVIWMCDPQKWNESLMPFNGDEDRILDKSHRRMDDYAFDENVERYRAEPLMLRGSYNSPRIIAQQGGFTVFGSEFQPLDTLVATSEKLPKDVLQKIVVDKQHAGEIFKSLVKKGIAEHFVYPDMEGLSAEVTRKFGFAQ